MLSGAQAMSLMSWNAGQACQLPAVQDGGLTAHQRAHTCCQCPRCAVGVPDVPREPSCVESSSRTTEATAAQLHSEVWSDADSRCGAVAAGCHIWGGLSAHRAPAGSRHDPPAAAGPGQGAERAAPLGPAARCWHGVREHQGAAGSPPERPAIFHPNMVRQLGQPCPVTSSSKDAVTRDGIV